MNLMISTSALALSSSPSIAEDNSSPLLKELEALIAQWVPIQNAECEIGWSVHNAAWDEAGVDDPKTAHQDQFAVFWEALGRLTDQSGWTEASKRTEAIERRISRMIKKLENEQLSGLDRIKLRTLTAIFGNVHLWSHDIADMDDHAGENIRLLIEANCELVGIQSPPKMMAAVPAYESTPAKAVEPEKPAPANRPDGEITVLEAYNEWLFYERRMLCRELYPNTPIAEAEKFVPASWGDNFHFPPATVDGPTWKDVPPPSTRIGTVFKAVGATFEFPEQQRPRLSRAVA